MDIKVDDRSLQEIVTATIRSQVADVLAKQSPLLVSKIAELALSEKNDSYHPESIFFRQLKDALRTAALAAAQGWLDEQKAAIAIEVRKQLARKEGGMIKEVANQLVAGFRKGVDVTVWFGRKD